MQKGFEVVNLHGTASGMITVPYIGENGNWFIGNKDTGVSSSGRPGEKGEPGPKGEKGDTGPKGESGNDSIIVEGNFASSQAGSMVAYPEGYMFGNCYIRALNALGEKGYTTVESDGVFAQLRRDGIFFSTGTSEKYRGLSFLLELVRIKKEENLYV